MNTLTSNSSDKKDVISIVNNHLDSFKEIALNTIKENGYNYAAVKCESNTGDDYSVGFLWSPDSV